MAWYGNWPAVVASIALSVAFALTFVRPLKRRDWRSLGIYGAFMVSLFTEMFGIPLTIYFLSSTFGLSLLPEPEYGHLLGALLSMAGLWDLATGVLVVMVASTVIIVVGVTLVAVGWRRIHRAKGKLVTDGIYSYVRHPQYVGILLIAAGFLVQWPTVLTLPMFPVLAVAYHRLSKKEDALLEEALDEEFLAYKARVGAFFPSIKTRNVKNLLPWQTGRGRRG